MFEWLLNQIPWWVPLALGGALLIGIFIGLRAMGFTARQAWAAVATGGLIVGAATLHQRGRRAGYASARAAQERADTKMVETRRKVQREVSDLPEPDLRERLRRWQKN